MVSDFLHGELDRQTGKAEASFREFLNSDQREEKQNYRFPLPRRGGWFLSLAGAAMAACLGFAAGTWNLHSKSTSSTIQNPENVNLPWVQQTEDQRTYDGGTYVDENGDPMRILQRRKWETTRWFDEQKHLKAQSVVPEDETVYVKMKTY